MKRLITLAIAIFSTMALAAERNDYNVQLESGAQNVLMLKRALPAGTQVESLGINNWYHVKVPLTAQGFQVQALTQNKAIANVEPNYIIRPYWSPSLLQARDMAAVL